MKKIFYLYSKSLLSKLALMAILIVGGGSSAWGDTIIFDGTTTIISGWTVSGMSFKTYSTPYWVYINGTGGTITSNNTITMTATQKLVVEAKNYGSTSSQIPQIIVKYSINGGESYNTANTFSTKETIPSSSNVELETKIVGNYTIQLECDYVYIYSIKIVDDNPYKTPSDFTLNSFTENSATFSWTAGNSETSWKFAYSTDPDFTPSTETATSITENPYTLSGLTEGTTYYARICADYGDEHYSDWTDKVEFTPCDETEITINEGTVSGGYAPIYGSYTNSITRTQLIIPSSLLTGLRNRQITKLTFYTANESSYKDLNWGVASFEVYMKPINNTSFGSTTLESWGTKVYNSATVSVSNYKMEITLNTPYNYSDGNLMIGFKQTAIGSYKYAKWIGVSGSSNTLLYGYGNNSNNMTNFNPQITFTTKTIVTAPVQIDLNGYTTFASPYPLDLTTANLPSGLKAYKAAVDAKNNKVLFTEIDQAVPANTGILLGGTPGTTYAIPVAASGTAPEGNAFLVNSTGGTFTADEDYTYYGMKKATSASDPIVFATFAPATVAIPTNKAYLKVANTPSGLSRQLVCAFSDNTTTAIAEIANRQNGQNSYFNLAGQRVDGSRFTVNGSGLKPGLYIINGKKVVIK